MRDSKPDETPVTPESADLRDVVELVADEIAAVSPDAPFSPVPVEKRPSPEEPAARDYLGSRGHWRLRVAQLRRRTGLRVARSRARLLAWRRRMNATAAGRLGVKLAVGVVGVAVVLVGVVLLPLPGPGWVVILAGLAILALEFRWARWLLHVARAQLRRWTGLVREGSWLVRLAVVFGLLVVVSLAAWASWALVT
jgi:uncharacterized protein (TIGR02611 family)